MGKLAGVGAAMVATLRKNMDLADPESSQKEDDPNTMGPLQAFQMNTDNTGGTNGGGGLSSGKTKGGKGSGDGVKLGKNGSGGGKSIVMNVTNNFTGFKGTREIAEAVANEINNRLSDGLAAV